MSRDKYVKIAKDILGGDIFDVIKKSEISSGIFKQSTKTAVDPEEIKIALQIVPRAILSFLISHLKPLEVGGILDIELPFCEGQLHINKLTHDVYGGYIACRGKKEAEFKYRSLPSIGLIILSTFELYDMADIENVSYEVKESEEDKYRKLQDLIDERLKLKCLIQSVVDQRISERDAIKQLIADKLAEQVESLQNEEIEDEEIEDEESDVEGDVEGEPLESEDELDIEIKDESGETMEELSKNKKSKLKEFLQSREKKRQEKVDLDKNEEISCPDCGTNLYKGENHFKLCVCYGDFHNKEIKFKKSEDGKIKFKFPKTFDLDNIEMLLDAIKSNK